MRRAIFLLLLSFSISQALRAQGRLSPEVPRYELGAQVDFHYLEGVNEWGGGLGARFHYNFDEHFALDTQITYRQHDVSTPGLAFSPPATVGQTTGLFGLRAGQRFEDYGFFGHVRGGFLHFGTTDGVSLLTRTTVPAVDVGATVERYHGPLILRFDIGELIVAYGNATVSNSLSFFPPPLPPPASVRLGTRVSPLVGFGFAVRF